MEERMDRIYEHSYLGRDFNISYRNHRLIFLLAASAGTLGGLVRVLTGADVLAAVIAGFYAGATVFVAWVLGRELDPDFEMAALVGGGIAFLTWLAWGNPALILVAAMILYLRMVNRTVGPPLKPFDTVSLLAATVVIVAVGGWVYGLIAGLAFSLDAMLYEPNRRHLVLALLSLLATFTVILVRGLDTFQSASPLMLGFAGVSVLSGILLLILIRQVTSLSDYSKRSLNGVRVRAGIFTALFAILTVLWYGDGGIIDLAPLSAALIGAALYRLLPRSSSA